MALSSAQKNKILRLLCYPYGTIVSTSLDFSNIVNRKLNDISGDVQTEVEQFLTWIDEAEDQLDKAIASSGIKKVDDIEFFGGANEASKSDTLKGEKNRLIRELSSYIGIPSKCGGGRIGNVCI